MYYSLIYPIKTKLSKVDLFRKKYDPRYELIPFHLTFVFLDDFEIEDKIIKEHIENILKEFKPFEVTFEGIKKSFDDYIFLEVMTGKDECIKLHDKLYTGVLEKYLKKEIEYIPHATIGNLSKQKSQIDNVVNEASNLNLSINENIDHLVLVQRYEKNSEVDFSQTIRIG